MHGTLIARKIKQKKRLIPGPEFVVVVGDVPRVVVVGVVYGVAE